MSKLPDLFREGLQSGWKTFSGEQNLPERITCDVVIVGTGAGAGITLPKSVTKAGLDVVLIEEGPLRTSSDFNQRESKPTARCTRKVARPQAPTKAFPFCRPLRGRHHRHQLDQLLPHPG